MTTKVCRNCQIEKDTGDFYLMGNTKVVGATDCVCKQCVIAYVKQRRLLKQDEVSVQRREHSRRTQKERQPEHTKTIRQWRADNPEAYKAQTAVSNALRDRTLVRSPCEMCGAQGKVQGHHKDYSKPLDVVWLCPRCHRRIHALFPELGGHYHKKRSA